MFQRPILDQSVKLLDDRLVEPLTLEIAQSSLHKFSRCPDRYGTRRKWSDQL